MAIQGTYGNDILNGTVGNDTLEGKDGNDIIFGNDGNDFLSGDRGVDTLTGGPGKDTFSFEVNSSGGMKAANGIFITNKPDIVTDFAQAHGDKTQAQMAHLWESPISARSICRALQKIDFT